MDFKSHGPRSSIFVTKDWVEQIVKSPTKWNSPKSHPNCPYGGTGKIIGVFFVYTSAVARRRDQLYCTTQRTYQKKEGALGT